MERFLRGDEVLACPPSTAYRLGKLARRHKASLLAVSAVAAALIVGTIVSVWQAIEAHTQRRSAVHALSDAEQARNEAVTQRRRADGEAMLKRRQLYAANMQLADRIWSGPRGNQREVAQLLEAWVPKDDSEEDLREFSWRLQWSALHESAETIVYDAINVTISVNGHLITADSDGLHEWHEGEQARDLWKGDASMALLSSNGKCAAIPNPRGFQLVNLETAQEVAQLSGKQCRFSTDGVFILTWDRDRSQTWHSATGKLAFTHGQHGELIQSANDSLSLSPDGQSVILQGHPHYAQATACLAKQIEPTIWWHHHEVQSVGWSRDGLLMASGDYGGVVYLQLAANPRWEDRLTVTTQGKAIDVIEFDAATTRLALGGRDGNIDLWNIRGALRGEQPQHLQTIKAHLCPIKSLTFALNGTKIASIDREGTAKLWDLSKDWDSQVHNVADMHGTLVWGQNSIST